MHNSTKLTNYGYKQNSYYNTVVAPTNFENNFATEETNVNEVLEKVYAGIENGEHGALFNSGSSVLSSLVALLKPGDHILCLDDCYGGTNRMLRTVGVDRWRIDLTFCDFSKINSKNLESLNLYIKKNTKLVLLEACTNPTLKCVWLFEIAKFLKKINPEIIIAVDTTFLTPMVMRPLDCPDIDFAWHSGTKYINGHTDVVIGLLATNNDELYERICNSRNLFKFHCSPFNASMCLRGIRTLDMRVERISHNASKIATFLHNHPKVKKVIHPSLPNYQYKEQFKAMITEEAKNNNLSTGIITVYLHASLDQTSNFLTNLQLFPVAESLGGFESMCELPALMTHASVPAEMRKELGIEDAMIRFSVGCENADDLIHDISSNLDKIN